MLARLRSYAAGEDPASDAVLALLPQRA
jgi:hypothetical protein